MSSTQPSKSSRLEETIFNDVELDRSKTHRIGAVPRPKSADLIEKLELKPREQRHISLGSFVGDDPPKGFSVEVAPDPDPTDSVRTEVTSLGTPRQYRLVMNISNDGAKTVSAAVWRL